MWNMKRALLISSALFWVLLTYFGDLWSKQAQGYLIGNRRRVIAVLRIECLLTALNVFAHGQLMQWFGDEYNKARRVQGYAKQCSAALILFLILGQAVYFMYYAPEFLQVVLFDLTSICAGIWTNMIAFVCGVWFVNFITSKMLLFGPTATFLDFLDKIPFLGQLLWNRKTQINIILSVTIILSVAMFVSRDKIIVKHKTIEIKGLTTDKKYIRLAVVSDLHAGASVYKTQVNEVVDKITENQVDAIFIIGDMVDAPVSEILDRVSPIFQLPNVAPTYFVTGNHEYYYGNVEEWLEMYRKYHINVLDNKSDMMNGVCIAGVNDIASFKAGIPNHEMNLKNATANCSLGSSQILLSHNPASIKEFQLDEPQEFRKIDLVLSGHTHAGQFYVVVPVVYWLLPYFYGLYQISETTQLFVMAGSLYQGPPMKMIGMSEVWVIDLIAA